MLRVATAHQFIKRMGSGKTKPCLVGCSAVSVAGEFDDGEEGLLPEEEVELVVKFSAGCEAREQGLVAESLAAMLAADLDLPVPEPFLVMVEPEFISALPDAEVRALAQASSPWAFGSMKLPPQYSAMMNGVSLPQSLTQTAAEVIAFDLLIVNPDRRASNPNCLCNGRSLAIFDHELAFPADGLLGWRPPWEPGSISFLSGSSQHALLEHVRGKSVDLSRLLGALEGLPMERIAEYKEALPIEWGREHAATTRKIDYILALRAHAAAAIQHITAALA